MLSLRTIENLEAFLLSSRVTVKGHELQMVSGMVGELQQEKIRLINAARVVPAPLVPPPTTE